MDEQNGGNKCWHGHKKSERELERRDPKEHTEKMDTQV